MERRCGGKKKRGGGALKVKPEIGLCDNNFKEQTNHAEIFVE